MTDLQIFPDYKCLHSAHLQTLQGVSHAKDEFAGVLTDLVKKSAETYAVIRHATGKYQLTHAIRSLTTDITTMVSISNLGIPYSCNSLQIVLHAAGREGLTLR